MIQNTEFGKTKTYSSTSGHADSPNILFVPGFGETISHYRPLIDALGEKGFNASTFSPPRKTGNNQTDPITRQAYILSERIDNRMLAKYLVDPDIEVADKDKIHLVAHSLGAGAALKAAILDPDRIASIILWEPSGMSGVQNLPELLNRAGNKVVNNQALATRSQKPGNESAYGGYGANVDEEKAGKFSWRIAKAQLAAGGVILRNLPLGLKEAKAAGQFNIFKDLVRVKELGIPVDIITSYSDDMFKYANMHEGYDPATHPSRSVMSVADKNSRHDDPMLHPERTARLISQIIIGKDVPKAEVETETKSNEAA